MERRIRKQLRLATNRQLAVNVAEYEQRGLTLTSALFQILSVDFGALGDAGRLFDLARPGTACRLLFDRFLAAEDPIRIWDLACGRDQLGDTRCLVPLCAVLRGHANKPRRRAAAWVFGWLHGGPRERIVSSLIEVVIDRAQPPDVRGQAAESLKYLAARRAVPALLSVLGDPEPAVRWWAAFAVGGWTNRFDKEVVSALEKLLDDDAVPESERYSVGKEALGVLGHMDPPGTDFRERLKARLVPICESPSEWPEGDRDWAATWGPLD